MNALDFLLIKTDITLTNQEVTNEISNLSNIISIGEALVLSLLIPVIKYIYSIFKPKCKLPTSLYFTQSFDNRLMKKNSDIRKAMSVLLFIYLYLFAVVYWLGSAFYNENVATVITLVADVLLIFVVVFFIRTNYLMDNKKSCHIGNNIKVVESGKMTFFLMLLASIISIYGVPSAVVQEKSNIYSVIILVIILFGVVVSFYWLFVASLKRDEAIALGYIKVKGKKVFVHYLEGDNYICSNYAYYSGFGTVTLREKQWVLDKKMHLLDQTLMNQIIDLNSFQTEIRYSHLLLPDEVKGIIKRGQYKKLTDQEVDILNEWIDNARNIVPAAGEDLESVHVDSYCTRRTCL